MTTQTLKQSYALCLQQARRHYENFPVASLALPRRLRRPVAALYAFARHADDLADEGDATPAQRILALETLAQDIRAMESGNIPDTGFYPALADTLQGQGLPTEPLLQLLSAFRQDIDKKTYANFGELMDYCRRSANPVGRMLLLLYRADSAQNRGFSDALCSALQLTNQLQDMREDYCRHERIYLPADEMQRFKVTTTHLAEGRNDLSMRRLVSFQVQRAQRLLAAGAPLANVLKGRSGLELRMVILGANRILQILQGSEDVFMRPRLTRGDRLRVLWHAIKG